MTNPKSTPCLACDGEGSFSASDCPAAIECSDCLGTGQSDPYGLELEPEDDSLDALLTDKPVDMAQARADFHDAVRRVAFGLPVKAVR